MLGLDTKFMNGEKWSGLVFPNIIFRVCLTPKKNHRSLDLQSLFYAEFPRFWLFQNGFPISENETAFESLNAEMRDNAESLSSSEFH